jgi:hypothetical protein
MAMLRIDAVRRLARAANIEAVGNLDVYMLVGAFGYAWPNDREIFFLNAARCAGVDKCRRAWPQLGVPYKALGYQLSGRAGEFCGLSHVIEILA